MPEKPVIIPSGRILLEGLYEEGNGGEMVIICHPHPLYGGNMDNNVVSAIRKAVNNWGWGTLRFNFRGVEGSGGVHGNGEGEVEDLLAAAEFVSREGKKSIHLAGYSYGAWIVLKALHRGLQAQSLLLASPPLDFMEFGNALITQAPCLIVLGNEDEFCAVTSLENWLSSQPLDERDLDFVVIQGCDHFYWGREDALANGIKEFLQKRFRP